MKKVALLLALIMIFMSLASCGIIDGVINPDNSGDKPPQDVVPEDNDPQDPENPETPKTPETPENPEKPDASDNPENPGDDPIVPPSEEKNPEMISLGAVKGLNEQILVEILPVAGFTYKLSYKIEDSEEYINLDDNLMIASEEKLSCYVLGIQKGNYKIKIEAESDSESAIKTVDGIFVDAQDRSGYAHFGAAEGVGAYNNDGTVKDGTKIIYVTNENKNTVKCEIEGKEYIGLVNILQAQHNSSTPMLIRIIGRISTNQWNYKNVEPRLSDGSNATSDFFDNTFSTEYGENLANLIVKIKGNGGGAKTYNYRTTADGLTDVRLTNGGSSLNTYKGTDFPALSGKSVYDDDCYYNMLEVKASKNITIEGIGADAELFQFGISFEESCNIEIKNLTFTGYPEDAINFLGKDRKDLAKYNRYWIHNCTFNRGYNSWDVSGERDKYAGDGSIDFNNVSYMTLSYNVFNNSKKSMLFGSGNSEACMNFTMHHNLFYKVESRLPLGRNVNIHSYNNYFNQCGRGSDLRSDSYLFSENNYFIATNKPFVLSSSIVKSYGDYFLSTSSTGATIASTRDQAVSGSCNPDGSTSYSKFDINPELFYYDAENKRSDVSVMVLGKDVASLVNDYAGAGVFEQLIIDEYN